MSFFGRHLNLGIAYTQEGASAVQLMRRGDSWQLLSTRLVSWKSEGLTNEEETRQAAREWFRQNGFQNVCGACCLLPQQLANTAITDFPPIHDREKLSRMVAYQTSQLGGLSGAALSHGFQEVAPMPGQVNPMLVTMAREQDLDNWGDFYRGAGVDIKGLVPAGLALYNAFALLQPDAAEDSGLQALLECGSEHAILVLTWQSRIQHVCMLAVPEGKPEALASALQEAIRAWKSTQSGDARQAIPQKLWISGEAAAGEGLRETLEKAACLPVELLGVPARQCPRGSTTGPVRDGVHPALTIAFGLAAQNLGISALDIMLLPEKIAWQRERIAQFPFLALAAAIFLSATIFLFYRYTRTIFQESSQLEFQEQLLNSCLGTAPKLRMAYGEIELHQKRMLPIVEATLRTRRFLETIQTWHDASPNPGNDSWCIYLADEFSFAEDNADRGLATTPRRDARNSQKGAAFSDAGAMGALPSHEENLLQEQSIFPAPTPVCEIPLLTRMYAGGILPAERIKYHAVKEFQGELNRTESFANVDDFTDFLSKGFAQRYFDPWRDFLATHKEEVQKEYTLFLFQLPFLRTPITLPSDAPQE